MDFFFLPEFLLHPKADLTFLLSLYPENLQSSLGTSCFLILGNLENASFLETSLEGSICISHELVSNSLLISHQAR